MQQLLSGSSVAAWTCHWVGVHHLECFCAVLQVQTYVRDAMTDQKDHKHRWHHLGMVQSIPFKLLASGIAKSLTGNAGSKAAEAAAKLLVNYTGSSNNWGSRGSDSAVNGAAAGRDVFKSVRLDRELLQHVGLPVVFHRTSFNSKFFPDCLDQNKIRNKYCEVGVEAFEAASCW